MKKLMILTIIICNLNLSFAQVFNDEIKVEVRVLKGTTTGQCDLFNDENSLSILDLYSEDDIFYDVCWIGDGDSPTGNHYLGTFNNPPNLYLSAHENSGFEVCNYESDLDVCHIGYSKVVPLSASPATFMTFTFNPVGTQWNATLKSMWGFVNGDSKSNPLDFGTIYSTTSISHFNNNSNESLSESGLIGYSNQGGIKIGNDVYYSFRTTSHSFKVAISTIFPETTFDTYLSLYRVNNNNLTLIAENDDAEGGLQSKIENLNLPEYNDYVIIVEGYDASESGDFKIEIVYDEIFGFCCTECFDVVTLDNSNDDGALVQLNNALLTLSSQRNTTGNGRDIIYSARNEINLTAGFELQATNTFRSVLAGCGENISNRWLGRSSLPTNGRQYAVAQAIGQEVFLGLGQVSDMYNDYYETNDFWKIDVLTGVSTQLTNYLGGYVKNAVSFTIENCIYVGLGSDYTNIHSNLFYKYNTTTNSWVQIASYPGIVNFKATAFSVGSKGYVGLAGDNGLYEYDPSTDTWAAKANWPGNQSNFFNASAVGYINQGYVMFGGEFYKYDPSTDIWTEIISTIPTVPSFFIYCKMVTINDKIYFLEVATSLLANDYYTAVYAFNVSNNTWTFVADGLERKNAVAFVSNKKIYAGLGQYKVDGGPFGGEDKYYLTSSISSFEF